MNRLSFRLLAILTIHFAACGVANSADYYWSGDQNSIWNTPTNTNWSSSLTTNTDPGTLPGSGDIVFFGLTPTTLSTANPRAINLNTQLGTNFSLTGLQFLSASGFGPTATNIGVAAGTTQTLTLGSGGITQATGAGTITILSGVNIVAGANQTWNFARTNPVTFATGSGLNLNGNTITINSASAAIFAVSTNEITLNSNITGSGTLAVTGGTVTLRGDNSVANTTNTSISGGAQLIVTYFNFNTQRIGSGTLTIGSGTFLATGIASSATTTVSGLTLAGGAATVGHFSVATTAASNLVLLAITRNAGVGATVNFTQNTNYIGSTFATGSSNDASGILGPWATFHSASGAPSQTGTAYATVSGGNIVAYTGATADAGSLGSLGSATTNYSYAAAATLTANRTGNTLRYTGGATTTAIGVNTLTLNGLMNAGTGLLTVTSSGVGNLTAGGNELFIHTVDATASITITGLVAGGGDLTKTGAGMLTLSGTNTFGGIGKSVFINGGTLSISATTHLGDSNNTIALNGGALNFSANPTVARQINLNAAFSAGTGAVINGNGANVTLSGRLTGSAGLRVVGGNGSIVLSSTSNDFTGGVFIGGNRADTGAAGAAFNLNVSSDSNLGDSSNSVTFLTTSGSLILTSFTSTSRALVLTGNGTINNGSAFSWDGAISGAGSLIKGGAGTLTLNGDVSGFSGTVNLGGTVGVLRLGSNFSQGTGSFGDVPIAATTVGLDLNSKSLTVASLTQNAAGTAGDVFNTGLSTVTLTIGGSTSTPYNGRIGVGGTGINLVRSGTGTQTLAGTNTYSGTTTINSGGITVTGALSNTSGVTVRGGGALTLSNSAGNALNNSAPVTLGGAGFGGGTLTTTLTETVGDLTVAAGGSTVNTSASQTLTFGNTLGRSTGGTLNFTTTGTNATGLTLTNGIIAPWVTRGQASTGGDYATITAGNVAALGAAFNNTQSTWDTTGVDNLHITLSATLTANRSVNTLRASTGTPVVALTSFNLTTNAIYGATGNTNLSFTGTTGVISSPGSELFLLGGNSYAISALISATNLVVSNNTATITIGNVGNTIADIYVNTGVLASSANGALGGTGTINLLGGTLRFTTAAQTLGSSKAINVGSIGGTISNALNSATTTELAGNITLNGTLNTAATTSLNRLWLSGTISGSGNIVYSAGVDVGVGTSGSGLILTGTNSFTGGVILAQSGSQTGIPVLEIGSDTALGTGTFNIGGAGIKGGAVQATGAARTISNALTLSSNNAGDIGNGSGSRFQGSLDLTFTGPVSITTAIGSVITVTNTGLTTFSGAISGTNGLTLVGGQRLQLSGPSTYTGITTVSNGTLLVGGNAPSSLRSGGVSGALGNEFSAVVVGVAAGTTPIALLTNAAISIDRDVSVVATASNTTTLGGNSANTSIFSGGVTLAKAVTLSQVASGAVTFSGNVTGAFTATLDGAGTVNVIASASGNTSNANYTVATGGNRSIGGSFTSSAGTYSGTVTLNKDLTLTSASGGQVNFSGNITGGSNVTVGGGGIVGYSTATAKTYTGTTTINANTTLLVGISSVVTGSYTGGGAFTVNGTLGGHGSITAAVGVGTGGILSPGSSVGTLSVVGNVTLNTGSTFVWEIDNGQTPTGFGSAVTLGESNTAFQDLLAITGSLTTSGTVGFTLAQLGAGSVTLDPNQFYSFTVATTTAGADLTGLTGSVGGGNLLSGTLGTDFASYQTANGASSVQLVANGNNVFLNLTPIPEPHHILLICVGVLLVGLTIRRRLNPSSGVA